MSIRTSELATIQEQLDAVLRTQEKLARTMTELRDEMASIIDRMRCPTHSLGSCVLTREAGPAQTRPVWGGSAGSSGDSCRPAQAAGRPWMAALGGEGGGPSPAHSAVAEALGTSSEELRDSEEFRSMAEVGSPGSIGHECVARSAADRRVSRFRKLLKFNEEIHVKGPSMTQQFTDGIFVHWRQLILGDPEKLENAISPFFIVAIVLNTVVMGVEIDAARDPGVAFDVWTLLACAFSLIFWLELILKLWLRGWWKFFCGTDWISNGLDAMLVVTDTIQLIASIANRTDSLEELPSASLFRLFRIIRVLRLSRFLHSPLFKELFTMVRSMTGGLTTLTWSFLPFVVVLYTVSLVCRVLLGSGQEENKEVGPYFETVPRSFLTMFRCSFGDFTSRTGVPIIEHVMMSHGIAWGFTYGVFIFFISIGVFNVIAAVFLDSTLSVTAEMHRKGLQDRLADQDLWKTQAFVLIKHLLPYTDLELPRGVKLSRCAEDIMVAEVSRQDIAKVVQHDEVSTALRDLDIDPADQGAIGDILDCQHTGHVTILDFVNGLKRLRGETLRRSDVLSVDLMVRSLQERVDDLIRMVESLGSRERSGSTSSKASDPPCSI